MYTKHSLSSGVKIVRRYRLCGIQFFNRSSMNTVKMSTASYHVTSLSIFTPHHRSSTWQKGFNLFIVIPLWCFQLPSLLLFLPASHRALQSHRFSLIIQHEIIHRMLYTLTTARPAQCRKRWDREHTAKNMKNCCEPWMLMLFFSPASQSLCCFLCGEHCSSVSWCSFNRAAALSCFVGSRAKSNKFHLYLWRFFNSKTSALKHVCDQQKNRENIGEQRKKWTLEMMI